VQANLVEVGVVVRDPHGIRAGGFQAEDFDLRDDGRPQKITVFVEQNAAVPKTAPGAAARVGGRPEAAAAPNPLSSRRQIPQLHWGYPV
jgi:hypothetical protein